MSTRDEDDDSRPEPKRRITKCKDRICGATDCPTCFPNSYDETSEEETESQANTTRP